MYAQFREDAWERYLSCLEHTRTTLTEDLTLVPNTHARGLTTAYDSSARGSNALF